MASPFYPMEIFFLIMQGLVWVLVAALLSVLIAVSVRLYQILSDVRLISDRIEAITDLRNAVTLFKTVFGFFNRDRRD
ncbi:MAG: hypothetical protein JNM63_08705 [Spirochaetia bacterium]|nr:hypothetical protein [Spirochaetia bacterium]